MQNVRGRAELHHTNPLVENEGLRKEVIAVYVLEVAENVCEQLRFEREKNWNLPLQLRVAQKRCAKAPFTKACEVAICESTPRVQFGDGKTQSIDLLGREEAAQLTGFVLELAGHIVINRANL